jgi:uncharacterized protein YjgD (DUF1641 family)
MRRDDMVDKIIEGVKGWNYSDLVEFAQATLFGLLDRMTDEEVEEALKMGWLAYAERTSHPSEDDESL